MLKMCCKCKEEKPLECFTKLKVSKDGLSYRCRECNAEYSQARLARDRAARPHKTCNTCGEYLPLSKYHNDKSSPDGKALSCRQCRRVSSANSYHHNKNKRRYEEVMNGAIPEMNEYQMLVTQHALAIRGPKKPDSSLIRDIQVLLIRGTPIEDIAYTLDTSQALVMNVADGNIKP